MPSSLSRVRSSSIQATVPPAEVNMLNSIKDTTKHVYWNGRENCYVALMAESPMCRAEGATPAEALQNVDRAYARDIRGTFPAMESVEVTRHALVHA